MYTMAVADEDLSDSSRCQRRIEPWIQLMIIILLASGNVPRTQTRPNMHGEMWYRRTHDQRRAWYCGVWLNGLQIFHASTWDCGYVTAVVQTISLVIVAIRCLPKISSGNALNDMLSWV
jgi:hypothetical protein